MVASPKAGHKPKSLAQKAPVLSGPRLAKLMERVGVLAPEVASSFGLELLSLDSALEGSRRVIRLVIDHPDSGPEGPKVTIDECARVSRALSAKLDEADPEDGPEYILEVSSPGLNRRLSTESQFRRFSGCLAKVTIPVGDKLVAYRGRLATSEGPLRLVTSTGEVIFEIGPGLKAALIPEI